MKRDIKYMKYTERDKLVAKTGIPTLNLPRGRLRECVLDEQKKDSDA
jgi:hypothetical protein